MGAVEGGAKRGVEADSTADVESGRRRMLRQSSLGECFAAIDADADGSVSFEEFVELSHRRGTLAGPLLDVARKLVGPLEGAVEGD